MAARYEDCVSTRAVKHTIRKASGINTLYIQLPSTRTGRLEFQLIFSVKTQEKSLSGWYNPPIVGISTRELEL